MRLKETEAEIYGSTSIDQEIDYHISTVLPMEMVNNSLTKNIQSVVGSGIDLGSISSSLPVLVNVKGTIKSPEIKTSFPGSNKEIKKDLVETGKKKVIEEKVEEIKKDVLTEAQKQADKLIKEAKVKAELVRNESNTKADLIENKAKEQKLIAQNRTNKEVAKLKAEGYAQADNLVKEAKSPLAKVAAQKSADKLKKSSDKKAIDLEKRLNQEADKAEKEAKAKAQSIGDEGNKKADLIEIEAKEQANEILENAKKNNMVQDYINYNKVFLEELFELLKIPSVSADMKFKEDVLNAANFLKHNLENIGADNVNIYPTEGHPIVYAEKIISKSLPTVLVYGHYDVQPADPYELWDTDPFDPVIKDPNSPQGSNLCQRCM